MKFCNVWVIAKIGTGKFSQKYKIEFKILKALFYEIFSEIAIIYLAKILIVGACKISELTLFSLPFSYILHKILYVNIIC